MTERALVTGATGFVGSHVARALMTTGADVHALVRPGAQLALVPDFVETVTFHTVAADAESIAAAVADVRPDVTWHLATNFVAEHTVLDVDALVEANVAFPTRLADALAGLGASARFVNAGTAWQHVGGERYRPKNLYAATKQAFEDVLAHYCERQRLRVITLNLFDTYGADDRRGKVLSALVGALESGEPLAMGSGNQLVDFVHVDDVSAAFLRAADVADQLEPGSAAARYAVSSGAPLPLREVVALLGEVSGRAVPVEWGARADRPGEMLTPWDAGPPLPGWAPKVDLASGLESLLR